MVGLTDDERTVLMIAREGQSMMPIGRWEAPVEHLVEMGFLERHDKWNNFITTAGSLALEQAQGEIDEAAGNAMVAAGKARVGFVNQGEAIATKLVAMAKHMASVTGDEPMIALQKCISTVRERAVKMLQ